MQHFVCTEELVGETSGTASDVQLKRIGLIMMNFLLIVRNGHDHAS